MNSARNNILKPSASFGNSQKPVEKSETSPNAGLSANNNGGKKKLLPVGESGGRKSTFGPHPPASVERRNARERNRVQQVNSGFQLLRQKIPILCGNTVVYGGLSADDANSQNKKNRLSKVETLRCAIEYIRNLEQLLESGSVTGEESKDVDEVIPSADSENQAPEAATNGSGRQLSKELKQELLKALESFKDPQQLDTDMGMHDNSSDSEILGSLSDWWLPAV